MSNQSRPSSSWFRPPELRTPTDPEERRATWLELFFDLVLVAAVGQLATELSKNLTVTGFARYLALFVPVVWAWAGYVFYANRFDTDDLIYRIVTSIEMLAVAALGVTVHSAMGGGSTTGFALAFVAVRLPLIFLYLRAWRYGRGVGRQIAAIYAVGFGIGASLWLVSIAVPGPWRYVLWAIGLTVDYVMPPFAWRALRGFAINAAHITERFGLFFIIVLGEAVLAVVVGTTGVEFDATTSFVAAVSFASVVAAWWIYFDLADTSVLGRGLLGLVFVYVHTFLFAGVAAFGAGIKVVIKHGHVGHVAAGERAAVCGGLVLFLGSLAIMHIAAEWTTMRDRAFIGRLVLAGLLVLLALAGGGLTPAVFMALVAVGMLAQTVLEARTYPTGAATVWTPPVSAQERLREPSSA